MQITQNACTLNLFLHLLYSSKPPNSINPLFSAGAPRARPAEGRRADHAEPVIPHQEQARLRAAVPLHPRYNGQAAPGAHCRTPFKAQQRGLSVGAEVQSVERLLFMVRFSFGASTSPIPPASRRGCALPHANFGAGRRSCPWGRVSFRGGVFFSCLVISDLTGKPGGCASPHALF